MVRLKINESRVSLSTVALLNENFQPLGVAVVAAVPTTFALEQNYPNPFNPLTHIAFTLPKTTMVQLKVMDALGRTVTTIIGGEKAAGYYEATWDASNVPSSIYFYRLQADDLAETKQMIRLK